jgi:hypothetical protein
MLLSTVVRLGHRVIFCGICGYQVGYRVLDAYLEKHGTLQSVPNYDEIKDTEI